MTATSRLTRSETQPRRGLRRDEAAAYVGLSPSTFDNMVRVGKLPMPKKWGSASVWDMHRLDQRVHEERFVEGDAAGGAGQPLGERK